MPRTSESKKPVPQRKHTAVRIDDDTLARLEALRKLLSTEWHEATVSDILRAVIYSGLGILEQKYAGELKKSKRTTKDSAPET